MKAKEYAKLFNEEPSAKKLAWVAQQFINDTKILIEERNCQTMFSINSVYKEQDNKWRAFVRRVEGVSETGYVDIIEELYPEAYELFTKAER